jgi:hypothetical protein
LFGSIIISFQYGAEDEWMGGISKLLFVIDFFLVVDNNPI